MSCCHLLKCLVGLALCMACPCGPANGAADPSVEDPSALPHASPAGPLRVMTFNIRYDNPNDGPDGWPHRRDHVAKLIRDHGVDLAGLQEVQHNQLIDLQQRLDGYLWYGVGRDDGKTKGEYAPIAYRAKRLEMLDKSVFWLSEQPDQPGSKGWDAALPRIVTWAKFRDRSTGQIIFFYNTHFDHRGRKARQESARLVVAKALQIAGPKPIVVTGDFNTLPTSEAYRILTHAPIPAVGPAGRRFDDARTVCLAKPRGPNSTWNGFRAIAPGRRIDFVFVTDAVKVLSHHSLDNRYGDRFPSDHLPVLVELAVPRGNATEPME